MKIPEKCPDCGGPMNDPTTVFGRGRDGIPTGRYVCRACEQKWFAVYREKAMRTAGERLAGQLRLFGKK